MINHLNKADLLVSDLPTGNEIVGALADPLVVFELTAIDITVGKGMRALPVPFPLLKFAAVFLTAIKNIGSISISAIALNAFT